MKLIGTFYLTNGCTHKEVFKVKRKDKKDTLHFVETFTICTKEKIKKMAIFSLVILLVC